MTDKKQSDAIQELLKNLPDDKQTTISYAAGFGLVAGIVIGATGSHLGLWLTMGLIIGTGVGFVLAELKKNI